MIRVGCYIDGFNLYHAIDDLCRWRDAGHHYKWVCLKSLMHVFTDPKQHRIEYIKYFSAFQRWRPEKAQRHVEYIAALESTGVEFIKGQFKEKDKFCELCKGTHKGHEEKESDVNFAVHLIADAYEDRFDMAYIVTRDSDLAGPMRYIRDRFPKKKMRVIAPTWRRHSKELLAIAGLSSVIREEHLTACRFPETVTKGGVVVATCPDKYKKR